MEIWSHRIPNNDSVKISESCDFDTLFTKQDQNVNINFVHEINVFQNKISELLKNNHMIHKKDAIIPGQNKKQNKKILKV